MQLFLYFANPKETILDSSHWCDNHLRPRFLAGQVVRRNLLSRREVVLHQSRVHRDLGSHYSCRMLILIPILIQ